MIIPEVTSTPFDHEALSYDATFENNPVTRHIRTIVWNSLLKHFMPGSHVLELNCGTGTDAIMLAEHGVKVTGIDSSGSMIDQARMKIRRHNFEHMVALHQLNFESLHQLSGKRFDGAFSNFGGLNCSQHVSDVFNQIHGLLKPDASVIACIMNKYSIWEIMSFLFRGNGHLAFRRIQKDGALVSIGNSRIRVWYYSLGQFKNILDPFFNVQHAYGLNIFSPSPNSRSFITSRPMLTNRLLQFDDTIHGIKPWNSLGDHFVIEAQRRSL